MVGSILINISFISLSFINDNYRDFVYTYFLVKLIPEVMIANISKHSTQYFIPYYSQFTETVSIEKY